MKLDIKSWKALTFAGIILAGAFFVIAIVKPEYLDWIIHPGEDTNDQIKKEMERQKGIDTAGRSGARSGEEGKTKSGAVTPTPLPGETVRAGEGDPKPECISRDKVVSII